MPQPERDPFAAVRAALLRSSGDTRTDETYPVRLDTERELRTGIPEVVFAPGKTDAQIIAAVRGLVDTSGRAIVSRVTDAHVAAIHAAFPDARAEIGDGMRTLRIAKPDFREQLRGGNVGILTAGTSDLPTADEARVIAEAMGCVVRLVADVGVAGLHRMIGPISDFFGWGADALIVAAGMDGALPSVVAGLSTVPVIGLPTPIGYGAGGNGEAALLSMLQTCAPGLVVVNIDNGIGAGIAAARIANQSAAARSRVAALSGGRAPAARGEE